MSVSNKVIIFYDRDGGGLGAHLQHFIQTYIISTILDLPIADFYPYTSLLLNLNGYCSSDKSQIITDLTPDNALDLDALILDSSSTYELNSKLCTLPHKYLLTGKHTYSQNFFSLFSSYTSSHRSSILRGLLRSSGASSNLRRFLSEYCNGLSQPNADAESNSRSRFEVIYHLRTIVDSAAGFHIYKQREAEFLGWVLQLLQSTYPWPNDVSIQLFSDCKHTVDRHFRIFRNHGFQVVNQSRDNLCHTSLAALLGKPLLYESNRSINDEIDLISCMSRISLGDLAYSGPALADLLTMSQGDFMIGTGSSFGSLARSMTYNMPGMFFDTHYINGTSQYTRN